MTNRVEIPRSVLKQSDDRDQKLLEERSSSVDIDLCMKWIGTDCYNTSEWCYIRL